MIALLLTILAAHGDAASLTKVSVSPTRVSISSPFDSAQLLVNGLRADGINVDLTAEVEVLSAPDFISISPTLLLRPVADGSGRSGSRRLAGP